MDYQAQYHKVGQIQIFIDIYNTHNTKLSLHVSPLQIKNP